MADGLVSAVVETVLGILKTTPLQEIGLLWGLEDELNKLASTLVIIQLVLQDAEIKQRKNEAIHYWLRRLKNTACDAENILDRMATEGLRQRLDSKRDGLKSLDSLEQLDIRSCDCLRSFPATILETLPSLRSLSFQNCKKLIPLTGSLNSAPALQDLTINGLPELDQLPESLQQLSSLRTLRVMLCERLSLPSWLWRLESLSDIRIYSCQQLKSLTDGFNSLKSLRKLVINGCPQLVNRCKKTKGEDWPKISDIPYIEINYEVIQRLDQ